MSVLNQKTEYFLTIDAGTSGVKAGIGIPDGIILKLVKTQWSYYSPKELEPYGVEFDPDDFWQKILLTVKEVIDQSEIDSNLISCIAVTSQRHGLVCIDDKGKELYSAPNRDARGLEVDIEEYIDPETLYEITGQNPPFLFVPARYLWLKENEEENFSKIAKILPINSWIVYKLTKSSVVDITTATSTQLIDLKLQNWSEEILEAIKLPKELLPDIIQIGEPISSIDKDICSELGLNKNTMVTLSGADTQSAILGSGVFNTGDIVIIAGSTMPIVQLVNNPIIDSNNNLWSGCYFGENKWLIEANIVGGSIREWFVKSFLEQISLDQENQHDFFERIAKNKAPGSDDIIMDLGIELFSWQKITDIVLSSITFPSVLYNVNTSLDLGSFCRGILENIAFAIRGNIDLLTNLSDLPAKNVFIVGGLSKSTLLREILANVLNTDIKFLHPEGTTIGGFIACAFATKFYSSVNDSKMVFKNKIQVSTPNQDDVQTYNQIYKKWLNSYGKRREQINEF